MSAHNSIAIFIGAVMALCGAGCSDDCEHLGQELALASASAERCDPDAATPCTAFYTGCVYIGVDPAATETLAALVNAYIEAECVKAPPRCDDVGVPDYVCVTNGDGANVCSEAQ